MKYEFTLIFNIENCTDDMTTIAECLGEAGFTDALLGFGKPGHVGIDFDREAATLASATASAIAAVNRVLPAAIFLEVRY